MEQYLVGGAVRDKLLDYPVKERDWVVVGSTPEEMVASGFRPVGKDFPVFIHPDSGEEYALARTERKSGRGYHGFTCHSSPDVTLEEDLGRRDLTINAMAEAADGTLVDPYGGRADLERRLLRHVSPAFQEDPLRILRVARFTARYHYLGFRPADETVALMRSMVDSGEVDFLVAERIWKETERALGERHPRQFFETLDLCSALPRLMPELTLLEAADWQRLDQSASAGCNGPQRWAALTASLAKAELQSLCDRLKAPNEFRELALLIITSAEVARQADSAEGVFSLLRQADALRRPERFIEFLAVCRLLGLGQRGTDRLRQALAAALAVNAATVATSGLSGKALGDAIQSARVDAIATSLEERPQ